ncbi:F-box protein CPR1-like [Telopea speciosissima]|uniref:F-box protein CPR1-like n=1 Tax=Telopea speciosissima TaxID=54955 RepID=UPI001CC4C196|nr:F-box protein CPR1-like [Telopea speciosissima]
MEEDKKKKKINEEEEEASATKNLPEDVIPDILSRLPVKSLLRFRCVCKPWCDLITDPAFVKMHLNRSLACNSNLSLIFKYPNLLSMDLDVCEQQKAVELDHPLKSPNNGTKVVGSCNGLLCLFNSDKDICLWNPSTKRHQKLPITPIEFPITFTLYRYIAYGFGYDPTTEDYKLVRVVRSYGIDDYSGNIEVKVYSLSTNSWRRIGDLPFHHTYIYGFGLLANSALHWVDTDSKFIVSFDIKDEEFGGVPLPDFVQDEFSWNVGVLGGQLCLVCRFFGVCVEVWMMKDYGVSYSWEKLFSIQHLWVTTSHDYIMPICYSKNGEVILQHYSEALILYDPHGDRVRFLGIHGAPDPEKSRTQICVGSLVPLNAKDGTKQPKRKKRADVGHVELL